MNWLKHVLHVDEGGESAAKREAALRVAEEAERAVEHSRVMRQLIIAETQYGKRVRGRGVPKRA